MAGIELPDWMRAYALLGFDDPDYRVITVDEHGQLNVLLRGDYEGEPRTVTLDDEGRISAFIIDSADAWGNMLSIGNAELAARLGSSVVYEQSGRVQFLESFEHGLGRWTTEVSNPDAEVVISPETFFSGGYSMKLKVGDTLVDYARAKHRQGNLPFGKVGIAFAWSTGTDFKNLTMEMNLYDGAHRRDAIFTFDSDTEMVAIYKDTLAPGWQGIMDFDPAGRTLHDFHVCKLVVDVAELRYDTFKCDQETVDISEWSMPSADIEIGSQIYMMISLIPRTDETNIVYVDDIIYTTAEP